MPPSPSHPFAPPFAPDRFELLKLLGHGGMGQVYLAKDHQLDRCVALKFLHFEDALQVERLMLEARCQASIRHPNVVPVYDVGLLEGRPCIAMAHIDGIDLGQRSPSQDLRTSVHLVAQAARGIHAAHRLGLIHGDLKPQNILVDRADGNTLRAYVTDFGLARREHAQGETWPGPAGTLAYMSPEHLLGDGLLDARSDIFSLGAVLYTLATHRPPFQVDAPGSSASQVLDSGPQLLDIAAQPRKEQVFNLICQAPPRPRTLNPEISPDLETILLHALEKEPHRRYPTAQAFADDLERLLAGEPIRARRPSLGYRLLRFAQRNRALSWLALGSFLGLVLAGLVLSGVSRRAQIRARLAQHYATQAQQIEHHLRLGHMMPPHDRRPHLQWARARMEALKRVADQEGSIAQGPMAYLEGATHLLMDRPEAAKEALERAWQLGFRTPAVAQALGEAAVETRLGLPPLSPEDDRSRTEATLVFLRQARLPGTHLPLLEARIALLEGREDDALKFCHQGLEQTPWAHEAHLQMGQVWLQRLARARRFDELRGFLSKAMDHFDQAGKLAPSDPKPLLAKAYALRLLSRRTIQMGRTCEVAPLFQGIDLCNAAGRLDPEYGRVYGERTLLRSVLLLYGFPPLRETDLAAEVERMVADGHRALQLDPRPEMAQSALAWSLQVRSELAFRRRQPGALDTVVAVERELRHLALAHPSVSNFPKALAYTLWNRLDLEQEQGLDVRPTSRELIRTFQASLRLLPQRGKGQGEQPSDYRELGERQLYHAELELYWGDPAAAAASLAQAEGTLDYLRGDEALVPSKPYLRAWGILLRGQLDLLEGRDPSPALQEAQRVSPGFPSPALQESFNRVPRIVPYASHLLRAEWASRQGKDPGPHWQACMEAAEAALEKSPMDRYAGYALALACVHDLRQGLIHGRANARSLSRGTRVARLLRRSELQWWPTEPRTALAEVLEIHLDLAQKGPRMPHAQAMASLRRFQDLGRRLTPLAGTLQRDQAWNSWLESRVATRALQ